MKKEMHSINDVIIRLGLSRSTIIRLQKKGMFPEKVKLSEGRVGWRISEVDAWVAALPRK